ncbi:MAG TPA: tetratricopeptide repeat protein [Oculatellaceae cyanobacterium]
MKNAFELKRLGELYLEKGDYETAEMLFRRAISIEEVQTPNSVALAEDFYNLGLLLSVSNKKSEAQSMLMKAWKIERSILGPMHPETVETFKTMTEIDNEEEDSVTTEFFYYAPRQSSSGARALH